MKFKGIAYMVSQMTVVSMLLYGTGKASTNVGDLGEDRYF